MTVQPETIKPLLDSLSFDDRGLVPAIAQQHDTGEVLMMAWMNAEAIVETLETGRVCYWSRSRQSLWRKGETSGHVQTLVEFRWDCDADTILLLVEQTGPACHTNRHNCFFNAVRDGSMTVLTEPMSVEKS
ncbi:MAG: phosphoribosyl-AMP cyclohydrolase [Rhodospirillales bacterium]